VVTGTTTCTRATGEQVEGDVGAELV
jgi:hypothetical protein